MRYVLAFILLSAGAFAECFPPIPAQRDIIADRYYDDPPVYVGVSGIEITRTSRCG